VVCCGVLQCVAVCLSLSQSVAVLQHTAVCCSVAAYSHSLLLALLLHTHTHSCVSIGCQTIKLYVFKFRHFVRHDYPYFYDKFDDRILRIPGAEFCHSVAHVCL